MGKRLGGSASPPGPLSTYVERGRVAVLLLIYAAAACSPAKPPLVSADSALGTPMRVAPGGDSAVSAPERISVVTGHPGLRGEIEWFYDWYLVELGTNRNVDDILSEKRERLSPELTALLEADRRCAAERQEICRLDFDPLTASQDPCLRYVVGEGSPRTGGIEFPIYAYCGGRTDSALMVTVVVNPPDNGWQFTNFRFPGDGRDDLLTLLRRPVEQ